MRLPVFAASVNSGSRARVSFAEPIRPQIVYVCCQAVCNGGTNQIEARGATQGLAEDKAFDIAFDWCFPLTLSGFECQLGQCST